VFRNRAFAIQSWFRRSARWLFFELDQTLKRHLFFGKFYRGRSRASAAGSAATDNFERAFGSVVPKDIPESTAWWREQSRELDAITDDAESGATCLVQRTFSVILRLRVYCFRTAGLMNCMVTVTHINRVPELLAMVRGGPFAAPTDVEMIEAYLTRTPKMPALQFADHAAEHVLSYQRRVMSLKQEFMKRCKPTPLGITVDYWDRTEARLSYVAFSCKRERGRSVFCVHHFVILCVGSAARQLARPHSRLAPEANAARALGGAGPSPSHSPWNQADAAATDAGCI